MQDRPSPPSLFDRPLRRGLALGLAAAAGLALVSVHPWRFLEAADRAAERSAEPAVLELRDGRWFDGRGFAPGTWWTRGGRLTRERPARVDRVLDLAGGWIVPAFGEAHNHNVESFRIDRVTRTYLTQGIFYVKNPNSLPKSVEPVRSKIGVPDGIDVAFASGGLTGSGGHPKGVADRLIENGVWSVEDGDGGFYFTIDDAEELERRWSEILEQERDFLKLYLLYSEEYAERAADERFGDLHGLDPALVPEIVARARSEGLRVSAHVETAHDFHVAVAAGVDEVNHLPGFRADAERSAADYRIDAADARRAAERGIVVVSTLGGAPADRASAERAARLAELRPIHEANLRILKRHGVSIAVGSDRYEGSSLEEALYLAELGVFDEAELLRMWTEFTARTIFPERKIGRLAEGYEASFLVLEKNPLEAFANVESIRFRVKDGRPLTLPETETERPAR